MSAVAKRTIWVPIPSLTHLHTCTIFGCGTVAGARISLAAVPSTFCEGKPHALVTLASYAFNGGAVAEHAFSLAASPSSFTKANANFRLTP